MMRFSLITAFIFAVGAATDLENWEQFKETYGKSYGSITEEEKHFKVFKENIRSISEHNEKYEKGETTFTMQITEFADMTDEEFSTLFTFKPMETTKKEHSRYAVGIGDLPASVDWRKKGAVNNAIRTTGNCGATWAFSATAAVEAQLYLKKGNLTVLSPQDLIDCANATFGNHGCLGGSAINAFNYIRRFGIVSERDYSYEGWQGACRQRSSGIKISGYTRIPSYDEQSLLIAAATIGPVSVVIDASSLKFYRSGIIDKYSGCRSEMRFLNFEAIIVAYDADSWTLKNCWGPNWGEQGYFRLQRNRNTCGVALQASYPVL